MPAKIPSCIAIRGLPGLDVESLTKKLSKVYAIHCNPLLGKGCSKFKALTVWKSAAYHALIE
jgi:hypothetical protein